MSAEDTLPPTMWVVDPAEGEMLSRAEQVVADMRNLTRTLQQERNAANQRIAVVKAVINEELTQAKVFIAAGKDVESNTSYALGLQYALRVLGSVVR